MGRGWWVQGVGRGGGVQGWVGSRGGWYWVVGYRGGRG